MDDPHASNAMRLLTLPCLLLLLAFALGGCAGGGGTGTLRTESLGGDRVVLAADYVTAVYAHNPAGDTSFLLSDAPVEDLLAGTVTNGQVMHVQLLWRPKAGATPMDASATNAIIRHVVISSGELGVYGGAGFAMPKGAPGDDTLKVSLRDATVRLLEATDGFADPLSPARVTGAFSAEHDPKLARKVHRAISQLVTNALGRSRFVRRTEPFRLTDEGFVGTAYDLPF